MEVTGAEDAQIYIGSDKDGQDQKRGVSEGAAQVGRFEDKARGVIEMVWTSARERCWLCC